MGDQHQGKIIKAAILKVGIPFSVVANRMNVSRSTLYSRFTQATLEERFILRLGYVIKYDFSSEFPHLKKSHEKISEVEDGRVFYSKKYVKQLKDLKEAYIKLLEFDKQVLILLAKIANKNKDEGFKALIDKLLGSVLKLEEDDSVD
jgi:DNA-binding Lrp family transcriptional regulator